MDWLDAHSVSTHMTYYSYTLSELIMRVGLMVMSAGHANIHILVLLHPLDCEALRV